MLFLDSVAILNSVKLITGILQVFIVFLLGWFCHELFPDLSLEHGRHTKLFSEIKSDFRELQKQKSLPEEFKDVAFFKYNFASKNYMSVFGDEADIVPTHPSGKYFVDTEVFQKADENDVVIFQFSVIQKNDMNKVAEISREYHLNLK